MTTVRNKCIKQRQNILSFNPTNEEDLDNVQYHCTVNAVELYIKTIVFCRCKNSKFLL